MPDPLRPSLARRIPWWLLAVVAMGAWLAAEVFSRQQYRIILSTLAQGLGVTLLVSAVAFAAATLAGLLLAVALRSAHPALNQPARLYCEVVRGVPVLVLLFYVAFVGTPMLLAAANALTAWTRAAGWTRELEPADVSLLARAVAALAISYGAFLAEVFRAGLQAVPAGQVHAAQALGFTRWGTFRHVSFPQALRTILPALGNDFISMVKDSALVSVLGVADISQMAKMYASSSFMFFETYNVVAVVYLMLTLALSMALRALERRLRAREHR